MRERDAGAERGAERKAGARREAASGAAKAAHDNIFALPHFAAGARRFRVAAAFFAEADLAAILDHHHQQRVQAPEHRAGETASLTQGTRSWANYGHQQVNP